MVVCAELQVNLAYRWFCKLSIEDKARDHSVFCGGAARSDLVGRRTTGRAVARHRHSSSASRFTAGAFGFLTLIQY